MPGIGVVLNPKSRQNLRDPGASTRLSRRLGDHGVVREARSIDELYRIAEDFKRQDIDVLGISGGDGTNKVTLTGFLDVYREQELPPVAFLRGGTMNTVANAVGVRRGRPEGLLARLVRAYAERAQRPLADVERHTMRVGDDCGFIFGTGVIHGFLKEYYGDEDPSPFVAAKTLLRTAASAVVGGPIARRIAAPFVGTVELDDGTVWPSTKYLTVCAGTVDQIGLNFRPFRRVGDVPETFHALGIHTSAASLVRELPRIFRAEAMRDGLAHEALTKRLVLRNDTGADGGLIRYTIDGDLHEAARELTVSIGPKVRILLVP